MLHLIEDFNEANQRLANQRKAMLYILSDYEQDRRRLVQQAERLVMREGAGHGWPGWDDDVAMIAQWFDEHILQPECNSDRLS